MKEKDSIKIEIEDVEAEEKANAKSDGMNIEEELKKLGQKFAETIQTAWNSEEAKKIEGQVRDGMKKFADEVGTIFNDAKESKAGQKVGDTVNQAGSTETAQSVKKGLATGLRWLSQELGKLSDSMDAETVKEKQPPTD